MVVYECTVCSVVIGHLLNSTYYFLHFIWVCFDSQNMGTLKVQIKEMACDGLFG